MNIGFDAKRAFHNGTGLGNYSRTLIQSLSQYYPEHQYYLFNPKASDRYSLQAKNLHQVLPSSVISRTFRSAWRSSWVKKDLVKNNIQLYHGLSHEIPVGIQHTGIKSVVTIHDLIYRRYPNQFNPIDVRIYEKKFSYACKHADRVIAISQQTKQDIIDFFKTPEEKIRVCYQSCNPSFDVNVSEAEKQRIRKLYNLPSEFFLYVGSIIERKNLLNICKAMFLLRNELSIPLVVIGDGGKYKQIVKDYSRQNGLEERIIFLSENPATKSSAQFDPSFDFPAIYQLAIAMIYPSFFEGFGIPVLEALWSRLPVITSNVSCLPETAGDAALYVNPSIAEEIAAAMTKIYGDKALQNDLTQKGWQHAQNFTQQKCAHAVMDVYKELW
jgi:glycosyltransferase involved in cell wall biosynthesis